MNRRLVAVMAVATGLSVANNYYAQPLLPAIGRSLHLTPGVAGLVVTTAQVGYAGGLILLLPLGDLVERRRLVVLLSVGTGLGLLWLAASPSAMWLFPAAFAVGGLSVVTQVLVPFAASLAPEEERGRVVGLVMSGLLMGVILARTVSGLLAETGTWRAVYYAAAMAMIAQAVVLRRVLPRWRENTGRGSRPTDRIRGLAAERRTDPAAPDALRGVFLRLLQRPVDSDGLPAGQPVPLLERRHRPLRPAGCHGRSDRHRGRVAVRPWCGHSQYRRVRGAPVGLLGATVGRRESPREPGDRDCRPRHRGQRTAHHQPS